MPRRKADTITVIDWPKLRKGRRYPAKVKRVKLQRASSCLHVTLENLDPVQQGRIHAVALPLPLRPGNQTCAFVLACGIDATKVGATIDLDQLVNRVVGFRPHGQDAKQFEFEQISNPAAAETAAPATETPETGRYASEGTRADERNAPSGY